MPEGLTLASLITLIIGVVSAFAWCFQQGKEIGALKAGAVATNERIDDTDKRLERMATDLASCLEEHRKATVELERSVAGFRLEAARIYATIEAMQAMRGEVLHQIGNIRNEMQGLPMIVRDAIRDEMRRGA